MPKKRGSIQDRKYDRKPSRHLDDRARRKVYYNLGIEKFLSILIGIW